MKRLASFLAFIAMTAGPNAARADEPAKTDLAETNAAAVERERPRAGLDTRERFWQLWAGYRGGFVSDAALAPYSKNDYLPQLSLGGGTTLLSRGRFSLAVGLAWDVGGSSAEARGTAAHLGMHRFTAPIEARAHVLPTLYAFVRAAPGVARVDAKIEDPSAPAALSKGDFLAAADVSAGAAVLLVGRENGRDRQLRMWLVGDAGYAWTEAMRMSLAPNLPDGDPRRTGSLDLGTLPMRGPFFRASVALSF